MKVVAILAGLLCCSGCTFGASFYSCLWITSNQVDCDRFSAEPTCGTNLQTYKNNIKIWLGKEMRDGWTENAKNYIPPPSAGDKKCEFSRAHCLDTSLDLRHTGACTSADGTTPTPVNVSGGDVVFDFMCTNLSHMDCPVGGEKVCASDGRTYENYCEYEKAKCTHRNLNALGCTTSNVSP